MWHESAVWLLLIDLQPLCKVTSKHQTFMVTETLSPPPYTRGKNMNHLPKKETETTHSKTVKMNVTESIFSPKCLYISG